jgi:phospholipid/cholesterol/gamma-HCH transport system substrate-binding protein
MSGARKQLRPLIAIAVLVVVGLGTAYVILQNQRLRIPVLEERPFELRAEFETAQAVVQGQGQTIRVAGVRVGDVQGVELEDGKAIISFGIDRKFLPVYRDATLLMRPTTGLKDMFFQLDPGSPSAGEIPDGGTVPLENTAPDVNLDEILAGLDRDTQAYLRLLLVGGGKGLKNRDRDLARLLGSLGPLNSDLARLNREVTRRDQDLAELIHNLNRLTTRVGRAEGTLTSFVTASDRALGAIAEQDPSVQRAVRLLPGTLEQAQRTLDATAELGEVLGPAFDDLRPFARNLAGLNESTSRLARRVTPTLENEIRPFVRAARKPMPDLRKAAKRFGATTPRLTVIAAKLNRLANMAAHNPNGAEPAGASGRDEGYLYWVSWLGHNSSNLFSAGDGHGFYRRIYLTMGCEHANAMITDPQPVVEQFRRLVTGLTDPVLQSACTDPTP